ncbi:MAG: radical SAM protein [Stenotrophomonas sp.]
MIVLWRLTTLCNLACGFCAYDRHLPQPRVHTEAAEVERLALLLARWQQTSGRPVLLSWLGGEPMLWPGLLALSQRLRQQHGLRISMTSNGTRAWQPGATAALAAAFDEITFSIDALDDAHDALRGWPGGSARLQQAIRALAALQDGHRPHLRANVVLMHHTLATFEALCLRLADWGVDEITVNQLGGRDRPAFHRLHALTAGDVRALRLLLPSLVARLARRGVRLHADDAYLARFQASALGQPLPVSDCEARRPTLFIDEHARISACSFTSDAHSVATREVRTLADVDALRGRLAAARRSAPPAVCGDCPSTQVFAKFGT